MRGEYFSWLSHDDIYKSQKIMHQIQTLRRLKDKHTILVGGYWVTDSEAKPLCKVNLLDLYTRDEVKDPLFGVLRCKVNGCAVLIHKSHFSRVGIFNPAFPTTQDYDLWFRMFRGQPVLYMPTYDVLSRSHEAQGSKALLASHIKECDALWIRMMEQLSDKEKINISGSIVGFYFGIYTFLQNSTGYTGAIAHAQMQTFIAAVNGYTSNQNTECTDILSQLCDVPKPYIVMCLALRHKKLSCKKRVMFQLGDCNVGGGLNRIVTQTANQLSTTYDTMMCSWVEYDKSSPNVYKPSVTKVFLPQPRNLEKYVLLLSLLQVDVYVYSYCCAAEYLPILSLLQRVGIKTIAWNHEDYFLPYYYPHLRNSISPRHIYFSDADAVLWLNRSSLQIYSICHDNGIWMPNPAPNIDSISLSRPSKKCLLAMGRFDDPRKGLDHLLQVFAIVLEKHPDAELYVVGTRDMEIPVKGNKENVTCGKLMDLLSFPAGSIHFVDWTNSPEKYYRLATLHLMPSLYEGFGLVVLEAAAFGVPTIAYDGSGMADIIRDGIDGALIPRGDYKTMACRVCQLLDAPDRINQLRCALPDMLHRFDPKTITARWSVLIDALTAKNTNAIKNYFHSLEQPTLTENVALSAINEYEQTIVSILATSPPPDLENEYVRMQNSLSWRITKPLRMIKKFFVTWQNNGFKSSICSFCKS